jgi:hypothetical protein
MGSNPEEDGDKPDISTVYQHFVFIVEKTKDIAPAVG